MHNNSQVQLDEETNKEKIKNQLAVLRLGIELHISDKYALEDMVKTIIKIDDLLNEDG